MPVKGDDPIGPFPPGADPAEYDKQRRRVLWKMPSGLYVIGSAHGDRLNLMTANWVTQVAFAPKLVGVGVENHALTHELITAGGVFTVNLVDREDRAIIRKFVKPVDVDHAAHTANGFAFRRSTVTGAPILEQAVAYVDCRLHTSVPTGDTTFFIGEVADAAFLRDEETAVLRMEDTRMNYGG